MVGPMAGGCLSFQDTVGWFSGHFSCLAAALLLGEGGRAGGKLPLNPLGVTAGEGSIPPAGQGGSSGLQAPMWVRGGQDTPHAPPHMEVQRKLVTAERVEVRLAPHGLCWWGKGVLCISVGWQG